MRQKPRPGELILTDGPPRRKLKEVPLDEAFGGAFTVREPSTAPEGVKLSQEWCECGPAGAFLCYPENGACSCGEFKHHVHCICGNISQTG